MLCQYLASRVLRLNYASSSKNIKLTTFILRNSAGSRINKLPKSYLFSHKINVYQTQIIKKYCSSITPVEFNSLCEDTLDSIAEYFEELVEGNQVLRNGDISYSDGVITAYLGEQFGTYVINRQTPNQQIWLSSPTSGPKRFDFIDGEWIYKHDKSTLHCLLDSELAEILKKPVDFSSCVFGKKQ